MTVGAEGGREGGRVGKENIQRGKIVIISQADAVKTHHHAVLSLSITLPPYTQENTCTHTMQLWKQSGYRIYVMTRS